jgi:hypothetical protein
MYFSCRVSPVSRESAATNNETPSLKIDGIISDDLSILTQDSERLQIITNLRESVYSRGEMLLSFSNSLQISRVENFDISSVVGLSLHDYTRD